MGKQNELNLILNLVMLNFVITTIIIGLMRCVVVLPHIRISFL